MFWVTTQRHIFKGPVLHLEDLSAARRASLAGSVVYGIPVEKATNDVAGGNSAMPEMKKD